MMRPTSSAIWAHSSASTFHMACGFRWRSSRLCSASSRFSSVRKRWRAATSRRFATSRRRFLGALNLPSCQVQPMIPIYLMLSGGLLCAHGIVRIFASLPTPPPRRSASGNGGGGAARRSSSRLFRDLCVYAFEAIIVLGIIVVVILGL